MNRIFLLALLLFLSHPAEAAWEFQQSNAGTNIPLRAVQAISAKVSWIGGSSGTVLRTLDGGQILFRDNLTRRVDCQRFSGCRSPQSDI
jgi:photosystem II stability/assembly factor-like uncharacterized protein